MTPNIVKGSNSLPGDRYDHPNHPQNNPDFQPESLKQKAAEQDTSSSGTDANMNKAIQSSGVSGAGDNAAGQATSMFDAQQGSIGSAFHKDGSIGQIGETIGGPLASDGMIGKNFNQDGAIGGAFQKLADKK